MCENVHAYYTVRVRACARTLMRESGMSETKLHRSIAAELERALIELAKGTELLALLR